MTCQIQESFNLPGYNLRWIRPPHFLGLNKLQLFLVLLHLSLVSLFVLLSIVLIHLGKKSRSKLGTHDRKDQHRLWYHDNGGITPFFPLS